MLGGRRGAHAGRVHRAAAGLNVGVGPRARVSGDVGRNGPEGGGDGDVAEGRDREGDGVGPDLLALRDGHRGRSREGEGRVGRRVDGAVDEGRGSAEREVRRLDGDRAITEQVRELHPKLASADRDVRDLTDHTVRQRRRRLVGRVVIGRRGPGPHPVGRAAASSAATGAVGAACAVGAARGRAAGVTADARSARAAAARASGAARTGAAARPSDTARAGGTAGAGRPAGEATAGPATPGSRGAAGRGGSARAGTPAPIAAPRPGRPATRSRAGGEQRDATEDADEPTTHRLGPIIALFS